MKGKVYPDLESLRAERSVGFAVVEHPSLFGDSRRCWWHRKRSAAHRRVASLWHRKVAATIEPLGSLATLPKG
jgi:hypothetical protein